MNSTTLICPRESWYAGVREHRNTLGVVREHRNTLGNQHLHSAHCHIDMATLWYAPAPALAQLAKELKKACLVSPITQVKFKYLSRVRKPQKSTVKLNNVSDCSKPQATPSYKQYLTPAFVCLNLQLLLLLFLWFESCSPLLVLKIFWKSPLLVKSENEWMV